MDRAYVLGSPVEIDASGNYAVTSYDSSGAQSGFARHGLSGGAPDVGYAAVADTAGNLYVTGASVGEGTGDDSCD
jgi:hypothetical protein